VLFKFVIDVQFPTHQVDINGVIGKMNQLKKVVTLFKNNWFDGATIPGLISAANQLDVRINYQPTNYDTLIDNFQLHYSQIGDSISNTHVDKNIISICRQYLEQ